jgi:segregation and condensation protein A
VSYEVSTPVFEGPFDLLLHLIAKEQVNLSEISLSAIVDAFVVEIQKMATLDLEVATEFLLIAATLIELKLRRLLPERANVDMDEELALLEERDLLLAKLLEYQTFRHAATALRRLENKAARSFPRTNVVEEGFSDLTPDLLASVTPNQLRAAFLRALNRAMLPKVEPKVRLDHVTEVRFTVADAVNELAQQLPRMGTVSFRELTVGAKEPLEIIVRFLAVLELFKQGWLTAEQHESFGDLRLTWRANDAEDDDSPAARFLSGATGPTAVQPDTAEEIEAQRVLDRTARSTLLDDDPDAEEAEADIDAALAAVQQARLSGADTTSDDELDAYLRNSEANAAVEDDPTSPSATGEADDADISAVVEEDLALLNPANPANPTRSDQPKPAFVNFSVDDYEG